MKCIKKNPIRNTCVTPRILEPLNLVIIDDSYCDMNSMFRMQPVISNFRYSKT